MLCYGLIHHINQYIIGNVNPLRLLFTDQTKVTTSAGGQNSVTQMIGSLYDAIEEHHGTIASRLFRAFRPKPLTSTSKESWRNICCIPYALIYCLVITMILACIIMAESCLMVSSSRSAHVCVISCFCDTMFL